MNIFCEMQSVDTFTLNLINSYLKDKVKNSEFEESMMETLFRDQKFDLILHSLKEGFILTEKIQQLITNSGELTLYRYLRQLQLLRYYYEFSNI